MNTRRGLLIAGLLGLSASTTGYNTGANPQQEQGRTASTTEATTVHLAYFSVVTYTPAVQRLTGRSLSNGVVKAGG